MQDILHQIWKKVKQQGPPKWNESEIIFILITLKNMLRANQMMD